MRFRSVPAKLLRRALVFADNFEIGSKARFREFPDCYESVRSLHKVCKTPLRVVFDIGAARGNWARTLNAFFPAIEEIVLFELAGDSLAELRKLVLPRVKLAINASALALADGSSVLQGKGSSASLMKATPLQEHFFPGRLPPGSEPVQVAALDAEIKRQKYPSPDLIKIDVQGLEWDVLKGGEVALSTCSWLIIEFSTVPLYSGQEPFARMLLWLEERGWRFVAIGYQWFSSEGQLVQFDAILTRTSLQ